MPKAIYINLVVSDLQKSKDFFEAIGFSFNPQFTNDQAAGLVISDTIFAMLHTPESIRRFTNKEIVNSHNSTEVLVTLQVESRTAVDEVMDKVQSSGGQEQRDKEDHGFMYERAFEDPDGHIWEVFWMDPSQMPQ